MGGGPLAAGEAGGCAKVDALLQAVPMPSFEPRAVWIGNAT